MSTHVALIALLLAAAPLPAEACSACVTTVSAAPSWLLATILVLLFAGMFAWPHRAKIFLPLTLLLWVFSDGLNGRFDVQRSGLTFALAFGAMQVAFTLLDRRPDGRRRRLVVAVISVLAVNALLLVPRASFYAFDCRANLKDIGTALELYAADFHDRYPASLQALSPVYLHKLPRCWRGEPDLGDRGRRWLGEMWGVQLGDYGYEVADNAYTVSCQGRNHSNYERLMYTSKRGLLSVPR